MGDRDRFSAERLRIVLRKQGRKQRWLAEQLGVNETYLSNVLAGREPFGLSLARRCAAALGIALDELRDAA